MEIKRAGLEDIELLLTLRKDFLESAGGSFGFMNDELREGLTKYYAEEIPTGGFIGMIGYENGIPCGSVYAAVYRRYPSKSCPSGVETTIFNVFTYPQYRGKGVARQLVQAMLDELKREGVDFAALVATEMGKPLYEELGFAAPQNPYMTLKLV